MAGPCTVTRVVHGVLQVCTHQTRGHDGPCDFWAAARTKPRR